MVSAGVTSIAVRPGGAQGSVVDAALLSFRRFYPDAEIELGNAIVRISSGKLSAAQLRTAWLTHLLEAKTHTKSEADRIALYESLFR